LRALLYMDEIFGYFPPVATPPSKRPLLTLLKQARAYGLGVVLATQNPADLDYKGLSNTGTWFIGRLQAERDKLRVLEGLDSAAAAQSARFDRQEIDRIISGLGPRIFLMHNVHEDHPQVFQVRWALSYLRGPLTRQQIKGLMDPFRPGAAATAPAASVAESAAAATGDRPLLPPEVPQFFVPPRGNPPAGSTLLYQPMIIGCGDVYYSDAKSGVSSTEPVAMLATLAPEARTVDWSTAERVELSPDDLEREPEADARFVPLAAVAAKAKSYASWSKSFVDALYRDETLELCKSPSLGEWSKPGESERDFRIRLQQAAREARDAELERLRARYAPKRAALEDKIRRAEQAVAREASQARNSGLSSLVRVGTTIMSAMLGRKTFSATTINKAGTAIRNVGQTFKESDDVSRARETVESLRQQYADLEAELSAEKEALQTRIDPLTEPLETVALRPKKSNITPKLVALAWTPFWVAAGGATNPAWK
jgi:hypothetical protein